MLLLFPWTNIRHGFMQPILGRTWLEWIRLSRIFRAPFANLSLESVKKMSRYYLLSGLSRIFRKPFANVYISRKVPFAQTFQIYACGPRLYKTFHGFLHDSHMIYTLYIHHFGGIWSLPNFETHRKIHARISKMSNKNTSKIMQMIRPENRTSKLKT